MTCTEDCTVPWVLTKNVSSKIKITFWLLGAFRCASDMFQIWFVRCSGIFFGANKISMLTVDHFARDEHVSKTGKSACVRIGVWKVGRFNIRWNNKYVVLVLKSDCNLKHHFLLTNTNKPSGCCHLPVRYILFCFEIWLYQSAREFSARCGLFLSQTDSV